ncbi:LURP-one-related/scramblase family protein [Xylanimonas sp. McL0601]|uniref:LURP-one-related/scramblase family protein n=1 Tax=Xylanimonas sp. McL0601 TaxID=3414739 RepID=UPI003CF84DB8
MFVDQKLWSVRERFTVNDELGGPVYQVEGSLFQIPKQFTIRDLAGRERARVWKKPISWQARFFVEVEGVPVATIQKEVSLFKPRYTIDGPGISVTGDFWSMSFELLKAGAPIGRVDKKWMTMRDKYAIEIERVEDELLVLGVVLAIDYVKRTEQSAAAAG